MEQSGPGADGATSVHRSTARLTAVEAGSVTLAERTQVAPRPAVPPLPPDGPDRITEHPAGAPASGRVPRGWYVWFAGITLVAIVLRGWALGSSRLGFDESFTAMAGRMPLGSMLRYLRVRDSHPPLSYLLRAPLARAGASELVMRLPSVACSVAAVALFAWWMRRTGVVGVVATALLAVSTFQVTHGRDARMYAELELIGVAAAFVAASWIRNPRRSQATVIGGIALVGLLTHAQAFLLVAGLLAVPGLRNDRDAWRWRAALGAALAGWAALWGPSFVVQSRGGHSSWIPRTSLTSFVGNVGQLVTGDSGLHAVALVLVAVGGVVLWRSDRVLARVWTCCALIPVALATVAGLVVPVLLDRTLTVAAWGPYLALGALAGAVFRRSRTAGALGCVALAAMTVPSTIAYLRQPSAPSRILAEVQRVAKPGDAVAMLPTLRMHELVWTVGVRGGRPFHAARVPSVLRASGIEIGSAAATGRVWLLSWGHALPRPVSNAGGVAVWHRYGATLYRFTVSPGAVRVDPRPYSWAREAPH